MEQPLNTNMEAADNGIQAADSDVVYLSDLNIESADGSTVEREAQTDESVVLDTHADDAQPPVAEENQNIGTAKDFSAALNKRVSEIQAREQAKYESSDEYQFGRKMLQDRSAREGITIQEARKRYEDELVSSLTDEYSKNPKKFIEDFVRSRNTVQPPVQQATPQQLQSEASVISRQVIEAKKNGILPAAFSPDDMTSEFISNVRQYGIEGAASRLNPAAQSQQGFASAASIADELERRRNAPRPMRPSSQGANMGAVDFSRMTPEQFAKYDAAIEKALMDGKRIR